MNISPLSSLSLNNNNNNKYFPSSIQIILALRLAASTCTQWRSCDILWGQRLRLPSSREFSFSLCIFFNHFYDFISYSDDFSVVYASDNGYEGIMISQILHFIRKQTAFFATVLITLPKWNIFLFVSRQRHSQASNFTLYNALKPRWSN